MDIAEFRLAAGRVHDAKDYRDVFLTANEKAMKVTFREMAKALHPDRVDPMYRAEATSAFAKLGELHAAAERALSGGLFGKATPDITFVTAKFRHVVNCGYDKYFEMTRGYGATSTDGDAYEDKTIIKVAQLPADNELLANEVAAIHQLGQTDSAHRAFYPTLIDSFSISSGRKRLRANVIRREEGFVNLEEVRERYPRGLDPLHMSWIWRRILWALAGAHKVGVLHGALVPSNIIIHPTMHGVILVDWCYSSVRVGTVFPTIKAIGGGKRDWYANDVLSRKNPTVAHDFSLAAQSMQFLTAGENVPTEIAKYFARIAKQDMNVTAYDLLAQYDAVLRGLAGPYHPRKFRPLNW